MLNTLNDLHFEKKSLFFQEMKIDFPTPCSPARQEMSNLIYLKPHSF